MTVRAPDSGWWRAVLLLIVFGLGAIRSEEADFSESKDEKDSLLSSREQSSSAYDSFFNPDTTPAVAINIRRLVGNPGSSEQPFALVEDSSSFNSFPYFPPIYPARSTYVQAPTYYPERPLLYPDAQVTVSPYISSVIQYQYSTYPVRTAHVIGYPPVTVTTYPFPPVLFSRKHQQSQPIQAEIPRYEIVVDYSPIFNKSLIPPSSEVEYTIDCGIQNSEYPFSKMAAKPSDEEDDSGRIVGGVPSQPGEFPWQVSVQQKSKWGSNHICGGAILSEDVVVTAGHCVEGLKPSNVQVVAGVHNIFVYNGKEQVRGVKAFRGRGYDKTNYGRDIALLVVKKPFKFDPKLVAPVCLPRSTFSYDGRDGVITGWGRLSESGRMPSELQVVTIPLIGLEKCRKSYQRVGYGKFVNDCQICTGTALGGLDSCQGDSGGPLTCVDSDGRHYLCGIVSWGLGCARPDFPGVYTSTPCYSDWIAQELRKNNSTQPATTSPF